MIEAIGSGQDLIEVPLHGPGHVRSVAVAAKFKHTYALHLTWIVPMFCIFIWAAAFDGWHRFMYLY